MELLITDVTEMSGDNYCVAGWDISAERMIRPLPNGGNWAHALLEQKDVRPGKVVRVAPRGAPSGIFPHRTEDTPIDPTSIEASAEVFSDWLGAKAPQVAADLSTGFDGHVQWNKEWNGVRQGVHILPRVQCRSLVAVRIPKSNLLFADSFGKLKATLDDGSARYQFTVSSSVLKEAWRNGGSAAVKQALPAREEFHVRIGLARPYEQPPKCYAMLNGVL